MRTVFRWFVDHWQALLCVAFIGAAFFYARENYAEVFIVLGLPIIMVLVYVASMALNRKKDDGQAGEHDLLTRVGSIWLRLTMPKKNKHSNKSGRH